MKFMLKTLRISTLVLASSMVGVVHADDEQAGNNTKLLDAYTTYLSIEDHYNSVGKRLNNAAAIIQQDRANFYKGKGDPLDERDNFFKSKNNRAKISQLLAASHTSPTVKQSIIDNGALMVAVKRYQNHLDVSLAGEEEQGRSRTRDSITVEYCNEEFESVDFCSDNFMRVYEEALNTQSANFNNAYVLLFIPSSNGYSEVVAIHEKNRFVIPLGVEIKPQDTVTFSLNDDTLSFFGSIEGYRQADSDTTFVYKLVSDSTATSGVRFARIYD